MIAVAIPLFIAYTLISELAINLLLPDRIKLLHAIDSGLALPHVSCLSEDGADGTLGDLLGLLLQASVQVLFLRCQLVHVLVETLLKSFLIHATLRNIRAFPSLAQMVGVPILHLDEVCVIRLAVVVWATHELSCKGIVASCFRNLYGYVVTYRSVKARLFQVADTLVHNVLLGVISDGFLRLCGASKPNRLVEHTG